jgi:hypothetical protein
MPAAPALRPDRDAGAACRPGAPRRCAAWSAPAGDFNGGGADDIFRQLSGVDMLLSHFG